MTSEGRRSGRNSVASRSRVKRCATEDSSERASPFAAAGAFHARDEIPMKCHAAPFEIICVRAESDVTRDFRASRKNRRCFMGQVEGEKSGAVGADRIFPAHDAHRAPNILSSGWRGCARAS